jgi:CRP-like cAMP-binding protein
MTRQALFAHVSATGRPGNRLLAGLPDADYRRLSCDLRTSSVRRNQVIQYGGEPIRHVYFPNGSVCSVTAMLPDGAMIEAVSVGDEGMLGVETIFGNTVNAPGHTIIDMPEGTMTRLDVRTFQREMRAGGALRELVARYAPFFVAQAMQVSGCNALHHIQQRVARWLLMAQERLDHTSELRVSHEFLGTMLGARRPTISVAAAALQRAGVISYSHGRVIVEDRDGLAAAACPCYGVMRAQLTTLRRDIEHGGRVLRTYDGAEVPLRRVALS